MAKKKVEDFLAIYSPAGLANFLLGQSYKRFRTLIYPAPRYTTFLLIKRSGGHRTIDAPAALLKSVQRDIASLLLDIYGEGKPSVHSFLRGRSVVSNASRHARTKNFILNIDLEDFFGSIHFGRVRGLFQKPPFSFPESVASILAQLCCYRTRLPQGAPTSPMIANFVARALDTDLQNLARQHRATYTRYCDDITFSFSVGANRRLPPFLVNSTSEKILGEGVEAIITKHSFKINSSKIRLSARPQRMEVTGLTVNEFPNVRRRFVDEIRGALHAWKVYGLKGAQKGFIPRYKKKLRTGVIPKLEQVLRGKLLYLRMVRGRDDKIYTKLAEQYNALSVASGLKTVLPVSKRVQDATDLARAVFVLEIYSPISGGGFDYRQGTAFLLEGMGLVSCEHVLRKKNANAEKDIVYFDPLAGDRIVISNPSLGYMEKEVKIGTKDLTTDIATLISPADLPATARSLHLRANGPGTGERVQLVGFPNFAPGKQLMVLLTQALGSFPKFGIAHFEIEALIRAGNSGGPVLDTDFYVVGMAKEGATQNEGDNGAIASPEIRALLAPGRPGH